MDRYHVLVIGMLQQIGDKLDKILKSLEISQDTQKTEQNHLPSEIMALVLRKLYDLPEKPEHESSYKVGNLRGKVILRVLDIWVHVSEILLALLIFKLLF